MILLETYDQYKRVNQELIKLLEEKLNCNISDIKLDNTMKELLNTKMSDLEILKIKADELEPAIGQENNLNDLKYLILNSLFFLSDLLHYCNTNEVERFKMRAINYVNHNKKQEFLKTLS